MKLGYKGEIKTIVLIFSVPKVKIMLVTMAIPISSHVKDKNSAFTAHNKIWFFSKKNPGISSVSIK